MAKTVPWRSAGHQLLPAGLDHHRQNPDDEIQGVELRIVKHNVPMGNGGKRAGQIHPEADPQADEKIFQGVPSSGPEDGQQLLIPKEAVSRDHDPEADKGGIFHQEDPAIVQIARQRRHDDFAQERADNQHRNGDQKDNHEKVPRLFLFSLFQVLHKILLS